MAITSFAQTRTGDIITCQVTSSLSDPYYHWYLEGSWLGVTRVGELTLQVERGEQAYIEVNDTTDAGYDYVANAPTGYPARRTLQWCASSSADTSYYRVEQSRAGGDWTEIGRVVDDGRWRFTFVTRRLDDLTSYQFRVVPVDNAGNDGTATTYSAETIVRRPDAESFDVTFNAGATTVTFSEA